VALLEEIGSPTGRRIKHDMMFNPL